MIRLPSAEQLSCVSRLNCVGLRHELQCFHQTLHFCYRYQYLYAYFATCYGRSMIYQGMDHYCFEPPVIGDLRHKALVCAWPPSEISYFSSYCDATRLSFAVSLCCSSYSRHYRGLSHLLLHHHQILYLLQSLRCLTRQGLIEHSNEGFP